MDTEQILKLLRKHTAEAGSVAKWANDNGFSGMYVGNVLRGKKPPSERLLAALGLRRETVIKRVRA